MSLLQFRATLDVGGYGSRIALRLSGTTKIVLAASSARSFAITLPSQSEGAGKTGCAPHPRSHVRCASKNAAHEHTGLAEASGLPCATALRLMRVRPGDRLSCHR